MKRRKTKKNLHLFDTFPSDQEQIGNSWTGIWNYESLMPNGDRSAPRLVSTLSLHSGAVMCVRYSPDGTYLASGSDGDNMVIIWQADPNGYSGSVFGSSGASDQTVEPWKCVHRLVGHKSDVVDLAWSPCAPYLASCGLDSSIIIWDTESFERVAKLTGHKGFVKGVCWDPAGKFLASQSDDKSIIIWNVFDWSQAKVITSPFEESAGQTFYKRLSWSPDGSSICGVHAVDQSGLIHIASIIKRDTCEEEVCLVGNRTIVECSAYCPVKFRQSPSSMPLSISDPNGEIDSFSVLAIGNREGSLSIWAQCSSKPFLVVERAFTQPIFDIVWNATGEWVAACSADGTVSLIHISAKKSQSQTTRLPCRMSTLGEIVEVKEIEEELVQYGFSKRSHAKKKELAPESTSIISLDKLRKRDYADVEQSDQVFERRQVDISHNFDSQSPRNIVQISAAEVISTQVQSQTNTGKRRIQPVLVGASESHRASETFREQIVTTTADGKKRITPVAASSSSTTTIGFPAQRMPAGSNLSHKLPPVETKFDAPKPKNNIVIEIQNSDGSAKLAIENPNKNSQSKISCISYECHDPALCWTDYLPTAILSATSSAKFVLASCADRSLCVWTLAGRRAMPKIHLESLIARMEVCADFAMCITERGALWLWNLSTQKCILEQIALSPLLNMSDDLESAQKRPNEIISCKVTKLGFPIIKLDNHLSFTFNVGLKCWIKVDGETPWEQLSDFYHMDNAERTQKLEDLLLVDTAYSSGTINQVLNRTRLDIQKKISLADLEEKMAVALAMESAVNYKRFLLAYARRLGDSDESVQSKASELLSFLAGPLSVLNKNSIAPDHHVKSEWNDDILGMKKHDLLREILPIVASNRSLQRILDSYASILHSNH